MLSAFDRYCLDEGLHADQADPAVLMPFPNLSKTAWLALDTGLVIDAQKERCTVLLLSPLTLSRRQVSLLGKGIALRAERLGLPDGEGPDQTGLPLWTYMEGPFASNSRWGIYWTHSNSLYGDPYTALTLHRPSSSERPSIK